MGATVYGCSVLLANIYINYIDSGLSRSALKCQRSISVKETEGYESEQWS